MLTSLCLQAGQLLLLRLGLGRAWLRRPVTWLVMTGILYTGLSAALLSYPAVSIWDPYRLGIGERYLDEADLILSVAMLALVIGYLLAQPWRSTVTAGGLDTALAARILDWRLIVLACAPLAVLTYRGKGYASVDSGPVTPISTNLAATFLIPLVVLAVFGFMLRHGRQWFLPLVIIQSILLAAVGERAPVVIALVMVRVLLHRAGVRPPRSQVWLTVVIAIVAILGITGSRGASGRQVYQSDSGLAARVSGIGTGLQQLSGPAGSAGGGGLVARMAARFDGVSFAGGTLRALHSGDPELGAGPVAESMLLAVPHALWPAKSSHTSALNVYQTEINDFGLPPSNLLPTLPGFYIGCIGPWWDMGLMALCGILIGWGERWLFRRSTAVRLVMLAGMAEAMLAYEQGMQGILLCLRSAAVLAALFKLVELLTRRSPAASALWPRRRARPEQPATPASSG